MSCQIAISYSNSDTDHDSISRTYLQELFGNFPSGAARTDEAQDDQSVGEYQIYEQYSDEYYSEDDDY